MSISRQFELEDGRLSRRGLLAGLAFVSAGALVACSSGASTANSPGGTNVPAGGGAAAGGGGNATSAVTVNMTDANKFEPDTVTVSKGGTVTWKNTSSVQHTSTCDPSKAANKADAQLPSGAQTWDSGLVNGGQSFSHTFDVAGTYKYFCIPHEAVGMVGTITVK